MPGIAHGLGLEAAGPQKGDKAGQFNQIYIDTFERIALNNEDIKSVLDNEAQTLRQLMVNAKAPCWLPDADSAGNPCPVH